MSELKKQFGARLRKLRKEKSITQEGLAASVGVTLVSISNMERGIYAPKFDHLEKLAEILEVEVQEMFIFNN